MPTRTPLFLVRRKSTSVPWLKVYAGICLLLSVVATFRVIRVAYDESWKPQMNHDLPVTFEVENAKTRAIAKLVRNIMAPILSNIDFSDFSMKMASFILEDAFSVWSLVSLVFCINVVAATVLIKHALGTIYPTERRPVYKKLFNYGCNKFFLVFAINQCQYIDEALFWFYWFATLALLRAIILLCKYKQLFYTMRSAFADMGRPGMWLMMGLVGVQIISMTTVALVLSTPHTALLLWPVAMTAAALGHRVLCLHLRIPYSMEKRRPHHYLLATAADVLRLSLEATAALYWLMKSRLLGLPFALMDLYRMLLRRVVPRYRLHLQYVTLRGYVRLRDDAFPAATPVELRALADVCAVCWFAMDAAVKLPCGHMYHRICLQRWLLRERSCPMCRASVQQSQPRVSLDDEWPDIAANSWVMALERWSKRCFPWGGADGTRAPRRVGTLRVRYDIRPILLH